MAYNNKAASIDNSAGIGYSVIRTNRRTLALEITHSLKILVRVPKRCTQKEIDNFVKTHKDWINLHFERQRIRMEKHPEPTEEERRLLIAKAKIDLPARVTYYESKMGLYSEGVKITGARTRFGSCSGKNRICFSWRLMQYPQDAIDYVVVHELAHIAHKNHGKKFYELIASVLPDYRARQAILKG